MEDIKLNSVTGDIEFTEDGDISITDSVIQAIKIRLQWFSREWELNRAYGVDYFGVVFVKNPNYTLIEQQIFDTILSVDGVDEITDYSIMLDNVTRKATITFAVKVKGEIKNGRVDLSV